MHPNQLSQYTKFIRYGAILLSLFLAAKTIEVYTNNIQLTNDISIRQENIKDLKDEINYGENYLSGYKTSIYAPIFVSYENGILKNPGEYRIKFELKQQEQNNQNINQIIASSPKESWNNFFSQIRNRIKGNK